MVEVRCTGVQLIYCSAIFLGLIIEITACRSAVDAAKSTESDLSKNKHHAEVPFRDVSLHGDQAMDWVTVKNAKLSFTSLSHKSEDGESYGLVDIGQGTFSRRPDIDSN